MMPKYVMLASMAASSGSIASQVPATYSVLLYLIKK